VRLAALDQARVPRSGFSPPACRARPPKVQIAPSEACQCSEEYQNSRSLGPRAVAGGGRSASPPVEVRKFRTGGSPRVLLLFTFVAPFAPFVPCAPFSHLFRPYPSPRSSKSARPSKGALKGAPLRPSYYVVEIYI
jgi:hypothetical protein